MSPGSQTTVTSVGSERVVRPYVSKIGVLPSSLPEYHKVFMETRKAGKATSSSPTQFEESGEPQVQSSAQQEETARRLKPHSRSQLKLDEAKRPAALTAIPQKKSKPTRWQFGIRSRNQPLEAIGCIYRALQKLGAEWVIDEDYKSENGDDGHEREQVISPSYLTLLTNDRDHHDDGSFASDNGENGVPGSSASGGEKMACILPAPFPLDPLTHPK
jgi:carbon catabolite-derepressing protein kinase